MFRYQDLVENKSKLFAITIFFMVAVLATPLLLPQIQNGSAVFHILVRLSAMTIATFLSTVAVVAYARIRTQRLLFTAIAFLVFAVAESFSLVDVEWPNSYYGMFSASELGHLFILVTLGMFALSVYRRD